MQLCIGMSSFNKQPFTPMCLVLITGEWAYQGHNLDKCAAFLSQQTLIACVPLSRVGPCEIPPQPLAFH